MSYVIAGYTIVLSVLAAYAVNLVWRYRRLRRLEARLAVAPADDTGSGAMADRPAQSLSDGLP